MLGLKTRPLLAQGPQAWGECATESAGCKSAPDGALNGHLEVCDILKMHPLENMPDYGREIANSPGAAGSRYSRSGL